MTEATMTEAIMTEATMTEETTMQEFGTQMGQVIRFFNRKGFGFIKDLNDDTDYFVHNSEIIVKDNGYRKLYPGEYVSYNLVEREGKRCCSGVRGILGGSLLTENEHHTYRVFPKQDRREYPVREDSSSDSGSDSDDQPDVKEVINKEAPEGIEVADFDGLNIDEEMS
jgi:cold shock CspA family protein